MESLLLPLHLLSIGIWLGCVMTEGLFERALLGKGREQELTLAALHKRVDIFIEVPAILLVLVTGGLLLRNAAGGNLLYLKVALGLFAIAANAYCVRLVFRRLTHATTGEWQSFDKIDHLQHKVGAAVLVGILAALAIGLYLLA